MMEASAREARVPDWFPAWAARLSGLYFSGTTSMFVLHGNVQDLVCTRDGTNPTYGTLADFLAQQVFGRWDLILHYDLARGLRAFAGPDSERLKEMVTLANRKVGDLAAARKDPATAFALAGIHAAVLLRHPTSAIFRKAFAVSLAVASVTAVLQPISGHASAQGIAREQPAKLAAAEAQPRAGVLAPAILSREEPDRVASAGIGFSLTTGRMRHIAAGEPLARLATAAAHHVDAVSGCAMLVRREAFETAGLFDEAFFFSFEDIEFCLRVRAAGFGVMCVPAAVAYHEGGRTIGRRSPARVYYATRNHLCLSARTGRGGRLAAAARTSFVVGLNAAYALTSREVPLFRGMAAVVRGTLDYARGRNGPA